MKFSNKSFAYIASALLLLGCEDYNEANFEGYQDGKVPTDVKVLTHTMSDTDYKNLFKSKEAKAVAKSTIFMDTTTQTLDSTLYFAFEEHAKAKANYFTPEVPATKYVPAFLQSKWPTATEGSTAKVTYRSSGKASKDFSAITDGTQYTLRSTDYTPVWGDKGYAFFSPAHPMNKYINGILKGAIAEAEADQVVAVRYNYSEMDPNEETTASVKSEAAPVTRAAATVSTIAEVIKAGAKDAAAIEGTVVGTYSRGILVQDATGSILVYLNRPANVMLGDVVTVEGQTSLFGGLLQFKECTVTRTATSSAFAYPEPVKMDAKALDAYVEEPVIKYAQYTGKLSISGNYVNVAIEGANTAEGSVSYAFPGLLDASLDGKDVTVTGYLVGRGGSKYVNTMATSIVEVGATDSICPIGVLLHQDVATATVRGIVVAKYSRGYLVNDGTGIILNYSNEGEAANIGDIVRISGTIGEHGGLKQFKNATMEVLSSGNQVPYPAVHELTGAEMDALLATPAVEYVSYTGKLTIDGFFYNVAIEGANTAIGSIKYVPEGLVDPSINGMKVKVTGYYIGVSGDKFFNTMGMNVEPIIVPSPVPTKEGIALYQWNGKDWLGVTDFDVLQPEDYREMGTDKIATPDAFLPAYLSNHHPYAKNDDEVNVVYNDKEGALAVAAYVLKENGWYLMANNDLKEETSDFAIINGQWVYNPINYKQVYEVKEEGSYLIVLPVMNDQTKENDLKVFVQLPEGKAYGYMKTMLAEADENGTIVGCPAVEQGRLTLTIASDSTFRMQDALGRYIYMKGDFNSFNVSDTPIEGDEWMLNEYDEGAFEITNALKGKTIMFDPNYGSFGSYPERNDAYLYPCIYKKVELK